MALINTAEVLASIESNLPDNTTGEITEAVLRSVLSSMVDLSADLDALLVGRGVVELSDTAALAAYNPAKSLKARVGQLLYVQVPALDAGGMAVQSTVNPAIWWDVVYKDAVTKAYGAIQSSEKGSPLGVPTLGMDGKILSVFLNLLAYAKRVTEIKEITGSVTADDTFNDCVVIYQGATNIVLTVPALGLGKGFVLYQLGAGKVTFAAAGGVTIRNEKEKYTTVLERPVSLLFVTATKAIITGTDS